MAAPTASQAQTSQASQAVITLDTGRSYIYLIFSLLIFSSSSSSYTYLNRMDPDTFYPCTILCGSNLIGLIFILLFFRDKLHYDTIKNVTIRDWGWLFMSSLLYSGAAPYLFMSGLDTVTVADAAILQRMESINIIILAFLFFGTRISRWACANCLCTVGGIALTLVSPAFVGDGDVTFSTGDVYIIASGICYSVSLLISMRTLTTIPMSVIAIFRVFVGTILYHLLVIIIGEDVMMLWNPRLWTYIAPYGIIYVFLAQIFWLLAIVHCSPLTVSVGTTLMFCLTILWSISLLGQMPTSAQWLGFSVISLSIMSSIAEKLHAAGRGSQTDQLLRETPDTDNELLSKLLFEDLPVPSEAGSGRSSGKYGNGDDDDDDDSVSASLVSSRQQSVGSVSALYDRVNSVSLDAHVGLGFKGF